MSNEKPNWTPEQLLANCNRHEELMTLTEDHYRDCMCNLCIECEALFRLTNMFSEDEHVEAIYTERQS